MSVTFILFYFGCIHSTWTYDLHTRKCLKITVFTLFTKTQKKDKKNLKGSGYIYAIGMNVNFLCIVLLYKAEPKYLISLDTNYFCIYIAPRVQ